MSLGGVLSTETSRNCDGSDSNSGMKDIITWTETIVSQHNKNTEYSMSSLKNTTFFILKLH